MACENVWWLTVLEAEKEHCCVEDSSKNKWVHANVILNMLFSFPCLVLRVFQSL